MAKTSKGAKLMLKRLVARINKKRTAQSKIVKDLKSLREQCKEVRAELRVHQANERQAAMAKKAAAKAKAKAKRK